ncbi:MAG: hypothetical protein RIB98_11205 [Acidimicrobiales bacterium]
MALEEPVTRVVQLAVRAASATHPAFFAGRDTLVAAAGQLSLVSSPAA